MSTISYDSVERDWDPHEPTDPLPRRPRRQFFNRRSAALAALITCAAGFYAGVRVEKGQVSSSSTPLQLPGAAGAAGAAGARASGAGGAGGAAQAGSTARPGGFPGFAGGNASVGTVASVNGGTLVLTETSGNTVKVRISSSTKITKSQPVSRHAVRPGDTIIVQGAPNSKGTTVAASVTDSGAGSGGASAGSSSARSGTSGSGSAVGSLFSGG
jgi:uncharacterized protein DUF5666